MNRTIPKHVREALRLEPGTKVDFAVDDRGRVVIQPVRAAPARRAVDRFESARGRATIRCRTEEMMRLLRGDD